MCLLVAKKKKVTRKLKSKSKTIAKVDSEPKFNGNKNDNERQASAK